VNSVDSDLATLLHQQSSEKAFTLSPLQVENPKRCSNQLHFQYNHAIPEGSPCWWRISLLDETLFRKLAHLWLNLNPQQSWQLGATELQVVSILGTSQPDQPWASFISYQQLYEQASDQNHYIDFRFFTPTAFRVSDYDCALPTKELVFQSLLRRWNRYSQIPFTTDLINSIYPSFFKIQTTMVVDRRSKFIGCLGDITFQILGQVEPLMIQQINTLADFALYAGVGRKTPMGMGITRRIKLRN
jgi:CRISPR-associated endoribonuclease Cas6